MKLYSAANKVLFMTLFILGLAACKKETDMILSPDQLATGSYIRRDSVINTNINFGDLSNSSVAIVVSGYGEAIEKIISYVSPTNSSNKSTWLKIKETTVTDNKATISIKATELAAALGIAPTALQPGKQYTIFNEVVTKSGKSYSLANTSGDLEGSADYRAALRFNATVVCPFDPAASSGTYTITQDPWDGAVGEEAIVTATSNTITITYLYPYAGAPGVNPITVKVNTATGAATVDKQTYGSYGAAFANFTAQGSGFVFSCTGTITLNIQHLSGGGANYGTYPITLKK